MADKLDEVNAEFEGEAYEPEETETADFAEESTEMIDLDAVETVAADSNKRNVEDDKNTNEGKVISFDKYRAG
jgi:hypothetical protein